MKLLSCHRLKYHVSVITRTNPLPTIRPHSTIQDTPPSRRSIDRMHLISRYRQVQTFHKVHAEKENYARKQKVIAYRRHNKILFLSNSRRLLRFIITEIWKLNRICFSYLNFCISLQFPLCTMNLLCITLCDSASPYLRMSGTLFHLFQIAHFPSQLIHSSALSSQYSTDDDHHLVSLLGNSSGGRVLLTVRAGQCLIRVMNTKQQQTTSASAESSD